MLWCLLLAISGLSCVSDRTDDDDAAAARFQQVAWFQRQHLTTDLIAVPEGLGMAAVDHGWQRIGEPDDGWLAVTSKLGRLILFSADGDLQEIELELSLDSEGERRRLPVQVFLNDSRVDRLHVVPDWSIYSVTLPAEGVRRGVNVLELAPRFSRHQDRQVGDPRLLLRRLRTRSRSGRPTWQARPDALVSAEDLELPVAAFVDLVVEIPPQGRIRGGYRVEMAEPVAAPAWAYIQLLDGSGRERTLLNRRLLRTTVRTRSIDLDLARWAGELVRLRLGTTGPGNGVVRWRDLRVVGEPVTEPTLSLPPIGRSRIARRGGLGRPDVFVILLDAARADAFGVFGGPYPTPATDRLAADGTAFDRAMAPAPWTTPSVPSILTGLYPDSIRIGPLGSVLPEQVATLPELLQANGYRTVLWSQHPLYQNHHSFRRGFEEIHKTPPGAYDQLPDARLLFEGERPTFAWIHLIPPHAPYRPPAPFAGSYTEAYAGSMRVEAEALGQFPHLQDPESLSETDLQYARRRYQENVAYADSLVARLLATLQERGRYRTSLIVLLSDHGEAFLEHDVFLHTRNVHVEMLHVPFVVKWPAEHGGFESRVDAPVSLVDLMPTLADGLGLDSGDSGFQGESLIPAVYEGTPLERDLYAVTRGVEDRRKPPKPAIMFQTGPWRILYDPLRDSSQLYQHLEDPGETRDLASERPLQTLLLRQGLLSQQYWNRQLLGESGSEVVEELDPEAVEQLQALGYLN